MDGGVSVRVSDSVMVKRMVVENEGVYVGLCMVGGLGGLLAALLVVWTTLTLTLTFTLTLPLPLTLALSLAPMPTL